MAVACNIEFSSVFMHALNKDPSPVTLKELNVTKLWVCVINICTPLVLFKNYG